VARGDVRARMAAGAARLLAERGLEGTSFAEVLALTDSPRGSTYHHFPGGKDELVHAALDVASQQALAYMEPVRGRPPAAVVRRFLAMWRHVLDSNDLASGCAVLAVTVATDAPDLREHAGAVFRDWNRYLATMFVSGGLDAKSSSPLAALVVSATEGAVAICRAEGSRRTFDQVADALIRIATSPKVAS
jgi:TetR/AcrR family transcriptional regulator, lmrAB and yxaGH operons repressor